MNFIMGFQPTLFCSGAKHDDHAAMPTVLVQNLHFLFKTDKIIWSVYYIPTHLHSEIQLTLI
jgi:hypothetical protein